MLVRSRSASALLPALASAFLALGLYAVTLGGTWVYDDIPIARDDPRLHDVHQWKDYLTQGYFADSADHLWRPLASMSFALQWWANGDRAWAFHLVNILLHAAASALVAVLAWRLAGHRAAWVAGLLFAAHPIHVDAVAYLVGRCETLAAIGVIGGLVLFIGTPDKPLTARRAVGIFGCFLIALFSKEQGLLLPFMLMAWAFAERWANGARRSAAERGPRMRLLLLLAWSMAAYILYRDHILPWFWDKYFLDWTINPLVLSHGADRWLIPVSALGRYTVLLIAPWKMSPDYSAAVFMPTLRHNDPYFYAGLTALLAYVVAWVVTVHRRSAQAVFCLACLGASYFLVNNVILIGTIFGERLMYLPSAFLLILFALAVEQVPRKTLVISMALLLCVASLRTVTYAARWNHRLSFYESSLAEQPRSVQLCLLTAMELREQGDLDGAAVVMAQARAQTPGYWKAWYLSAQVALERGELREAQRFIDQALRLDPAQVSGLALPDQIRSRQFMSPRSTMPLVK